jgi:PAS domain S-box-containing protein
LGRRKKRSKYKANLVETNRKLRESEARLQEVHRLARLGNWELELASMKMVWSEEVYRIFDLQPEEVPLSIPEIFDHIHPEDRARIKALGTLVREQNEPQDLHCRIVGRDGGIRYIQSCAKRHIDKTDKAIRLSGTVIDVTEKIKLYDALKASDRRFEAFMEHNPAFAFIKDRQGNILYMNRACEKLWDLENDSWRGRSDEELWPLEIAQEFHKADMQVFETNRPCTEVLELPVANGATRTLLTYKFPLELPGEEWLLGGVSIDITEQKAAEKRTLYALADREVLLKEVHHRVKNNLQVISSLLSMQAAGCHDGFTTAALRESQDRVLSMARIHEMLYGSGSLRDVDFNKYIEELMSQLLSSYGCSPERIRPVLRIEPMRFDIDRGIPCGLILNELVSNSLKYAFPNGRKGEIVVSLRLTDDDQRELTVEDNGIGLPEGFSLDSTHTLGLRIVNILVKQMEGELRFSSVNGSRFTFTFPVHTPEPALLDEERPLISSQ